MSNTDYFGSKLTREIWGSLDNIMLVYVGSAADFALNPEIDWLFYTMRLPEQPQMRFIETFSYNKRVFNMPKDQVAHFLGQIRHIHTRLEQQRTEAAGKEHKMSNIAFKEVGDMLIAYGIRGYEYLHRCQLLPEDKEAYYQDMKKFMELMQIQDLPDTFIAWEQERHFDIENRLKVNEYTEKLYKAYKHDMGWFRYHILLSFQSWFIDPRIAKKLKLKKRLYFYFPYIVYPLINSKSLLGLVLRFLMKPNVYTKLQKMTDSDHDYSASSSHSSPSS